MSNIIHIYKVIQNNMHKAFLLAEMLQRNVRFRQLIEIKVYTKINIKLISEIFSKSEYKYQENYRWNTTRRQ